MKGNLTVNKTDNSYNFSEFDDYSLCISGSPPKGDNPKTSSVDNRKSNIIETSTPLAKRTRSYVPVSFSRDNTGSCADISYIDSVDDTPSPGSQTSELEWNDSFLLLEVKFKKKSAVALDSPQPYILRIIPVVPSLHCGSQLLSSMCYYCKNFRVAT
jgi:hypothetical protein